jgi:hypothetical protein
MTTESQQPEPQKPVPPKPPARELPSPEQIGAWMAGDDLPILAHLFEKPSLKLFDALVMQIRKEELLPQHWQVISQRQIPDSLDFHQLGEVGRLRQTYKDGKVLQDRLAALEVAWRELGGKQPALWTVADLFAALRRNIEHELGVDVHDLLSAARDVWAGMILPHGRTQLDGLWAVLLFVRSKTKK